MNIVFNEEDVRKFYKFFKHKNSTEIRVFDKEKYPNGKSIFVKSEDEFVKQCRFYSEQDKINVYIGARDREGLGDKNIISSHFILFEIDEHDIKKSELKKKILDWLEKNNIKVGMQGMSGGGFHFYIPHKLQKFKNSDEAFYYKDNSLALFKKVIIGNGFDVDPAVFNLERVMRVLGTYNFTRNKLSNIDYIDKEIDLESNTKALQTLVKSEIPVTAAHTEIKYDADDDEFIKSVKEKWIEGDREALALSVAGYLRKKKRLGIISALSIVSKICDDCNDEEKESRLVGVRATYNKDEKDVKGISGLIEKKIIKKEDMTAFTRRGQVESFWETQPFCFDNSKIFWLWDKENFKWNRSDETDLANLIYDQLGIETIGSKSKSELTEGFKQVGRKHKPIDIDGNWVQYKDRLYNIDDGESIEASYKYFITNPIPYSIGDSEDTPMIDELFSSWVGEEHMQELYEVLAFSQAPKYFIHRIICLIGSGANGKSTYLTLLRNYLNDDNVVSSSLESLMKVRFEGSKLYKKLVCLMGETNFGTLKTTEYIKGLSGEDKLRIEFKGKDGFDAVNYAKLILATNSLPATADKTDGFYRRWKIINFNNKFPEEKDVLSIIPKEEYNNLAKKCFRILQEMWGR